MHASYTTVRKILWSLLGCGLFLLASMTLLPNAATCIWQIKWYPLHLCSLALIGLGGCGFLLNPRTRKSLSSPGLLLLLVLIPMGLTAGALTGPFPERALIYSLNTLAAVFCGAILMVHLRKEEVFRLFQSRTFQVTLAAFVCIWSSVSLYRYFTQQLLPFLDMAKQLDQAANGGIYDLIIGKHFSTTMRNGRPFGHPNYNSGFLLILLPLLSYGFVTPASKGLRGFSLLALVLGMAVLISTQSRNALLGIGVAAGMGIWWNQLQRKRALQIMGGLAVIGLGVLWLFPRFQQILTSVSPARRGMWQAAWMTGKHYFPFGSGEGLTPEMLQLFSPRLSSIWENSIQFHHTWLHLWATGGVLSAVGILGITLWIFLRLLFPGKMDLQTRRLVTPSVMAVSASFIVFWADYQLDIFPVALLLYFHLAVLAAMTGSGECVSTRIRHSAKLLPVLPGICLLICVVVLPASLKSRNRIEQAGRAYEQGDIPTAVSKYLEAFDAVPEPYSLNMAGTLLSQNPGTRAEAVALFDQSLMLWEPQILAHEFLVNLRLEEAQASTDAVTAQTALEKALHHARRRTDMAPQLQGSYLDLAFILQKLGRPGREITDALYRELLMRGDLLFPEIWKVLGRLQPYRSAVLIRLMREPSSTSTRIQGRINTWQGFLSALQEVPSGFQVAANVQEKFNQRLQKPGSLQLLNEVHLAEKANRAEAMKRLLIFLFESPVSDETVASFLADLPQNSVPLAALLNFGQARLQSTAFTGIGISARHPFTVPVTRPRAYPNVFGSRLLPSSPQKLFPPESEKSP